MLMRTQVHEGKRVLVVGSASGYEAAIAGQMGARVEALQKDASLRIAEEKRLRALGYDIPVHEEMPAGGRYDAILVLSPSAAPDSSLLASLDSGGRLVMPRTEEGSRQRLMLYVRETPERISEHPGEPFQLAPDRSVGPAREPQPGGS